MNAALKSQREEFEKQDLEHKHQIESIIDELSKAIKEAIAKNEISETEKEISRSSLFGLGVGREMFSEAVSSVAEYDSVLAQHLNSSMLSIIIGMFGAGGLVIKSESLTLAVQKSFKADLTKKALEGLAKSKKLEDDAIRYALSVPLKHPLKSRTGPSAYAARIVDEANDWLKKQGSPGSLTEDAIAKRLKNRARDFPPPDSWPR